MKIQDDHVVDEPEQVTRFVCGAVLGALMGVVLVLGGGGASFLGAIVAFLAPMIGFGLLALVLGDRFWEKAIEWLRCFISLG